MLKLHFFNVGDGDALLIEEIEGLHTYRMLVDTGRSKVVEPFPSATCCKHLMQLGISRLDKVLITHLHPDHAGAHRDLSRHLVIEELISGYIPVCTDAQIPEDPTAIKTIQGMIQCLNQWTEDIGRLQHVGCRITQLFDTMRDVALTPKLSVDYIVPDVHASRLQRDVWNRMIDGSEVSSERLVRASKLRNPNSIRMRLHYAGREVCLGADCFGSLWEDEALKPCDIFKVPHHGDVKALTDRLVTKLRPSHAVISCARDYLPAKDRPSSDTIRKLRKVGSRVWYTDAYDDGHQPVRVWPSVDFTILEDGRILPPSL